MCGLAGIFHYADPDRLPTARRFTRMTRALAHRGPDGEGFHVDGPSASATVGSPSSTSPRLSAQPMPSTAAPSSLPTTVSPYNHQRFRKELRGPRRALPGAPDTETLLRRVARSGPDVLSDAAGIFAFALYDRDKRRLTLARDPSG
ncbi:MAG: hypothetical protein IPF99_35020 [Deltaproteobacteria bacterium]|nr:hypothetical protein [Deltaproteobacteria bacterium]